MLRLSWAGPLSLCVLLAACGERELILDGERLDLRASLTGADAAASPQTPGSAPFRAPAEQANADWTHLRGTPAHSLENPAISAIRGPIWTVEIGRGNSRGHRITAAPVLADGRIFTLDSRARITAVSTGGQVLWSADMTPPTERADDASGGGLAVSGARLYATSGFGLLAAFDAATGAMVWTQDLGAVATGAPTVLDGRVFVSARDGRGWAVDTADGKVLWEVAATRSRSGVIGGPSPAATGQAVVFAFGSGELIAADPASGQQIWTNYVVGERPGRVAARIGDITGAPVIVGGRVFAGNNSGRSAAIEFGTGQTVWTAEEGAMSPAWVAGGAVFVISDESELVRLDAATGARVWGVELPFFTNDRLRRRKDIFAHYGPVLAGGQLIVASNDGLVRVFSPEDGTLLRTVEVPGGAAADPVVAGGTLYLVTANGRLTAFR